VIDEDQQAACIVPLQLFIGIRPHEPPGLDRTTCHCHTPGCERLAENRPDMIGAAPPASQPRRKCPWTPSPPVRLC
jgi:hypothetical protein